MSKDMGPPDGMTKHQVLQPLNSSTASLPHSHMDVAVSVQPEVLGRKSGMMSPSLLKTHKTMIVTGNCTTFGMFLGETVSHLLWDLIFWPWHVWLQWVNLMISFLVCCRQFYCITLDRNCPLLILKKRSACPHVPPACSNSSFTPFLPGNDTHELRLQ